MYKQKPTRGKQMFGKRFKKIRAWNCYAFLAVHIVNELKAFKKYNVNTYPHEFQMSDGGNGSKAWHEAVDKMIYSFDQIAKDYPDGFAIKDFKSPEFTAYRTKIDEGLHLFAKHFENLWD